MKNCLLYALLCIVPVTVAVAESMRPDVIEFMRVLQLEESMNSSLAHMQTAFEKQLSMSLGEGSNQSAEMKKSMERVSKLIKEKMGWDALKDELAKIYQESFTAEELAGLTAFFKTPTGQAYVKKMPELMQKVAAVNQMRFQEVMPELQRIVMEANSKNMPPDAAQALGE